MPSRQESRSARPTLDKLRLFRNHPVFGQLAPDQIEHLCSYAQTRRVSRGATIFKKGDPGNSLFAIAAGTVKIDVPSAGGREAVFNLVQEGEILGEIALLDGQPRTADATAMTDCVLIVIDRRDFVPFVTARPEIAMKLIEVLCARLRHASQQIEDVMFLDFPARLAKTLLRLSQRTKPSADGRKVAITQSEIGGIVGLSRESTNRFLRAWADRGWVRLQRGGIVVRAPDALAALAVADAPDDAT
jgi:CRP/FNR family transcriptional regulator, cyclic AMP receptor protein